jgi:hypothetical protein
MSKKRDIHVVPYRDGGWAMRKENSERVSSTHVTQNAAINQAVKQAKNDKVEVVIHRRDGTIRDSDSYGNDPNPPKDRKR